MYKVIAEKDYPYECESLDFNSFAEVMKYIKCRLNLKHDCWQDDIERDLIRHRKSSFSGRCEDGYLNLRIYMFKE